jgi:hypothetical protein
MFGRPGGKGGRGSFLVGGGRKPLMGFGDRRPITDDESVQQVPKRLPPTPIYEGGTRTYQRQRPKQLRDILYDCMCDWAYHSREELDTLMPDRQWVKAMCELVAMDYTFDRHDCYLRLRKRRLREPEPSIVDIISGLLFPTEYGAGTAAPEIQDPVVKTEDDEPFESVELDGGDMLTLDDEGTFSISLTQMVTDMSAVLARRGAGKTYLAMGIAESFLFNEAHEVPFVWLDPMGVGWGLLANEDGSPIDEDIVLLGGPRGHRPLSYDRGRVVAQAVKELRLPFVLDMSLMNENEQHQFVADFLSEIYLVNRLPLHIFLDEVDLFAPQKLTAGAKYQARCLAAVDNLVRRGRTHGLGGTLISQRVAVVHKNVLTQLRQLFLLQTGAPHDLKAVSSWFTAEVSREQIRNCIDELPILPAGMAYYACGGENYRFGKFKVKHKRTFDSSYTPKIDEVPKVATIYSLRDELLKELDSILVNENVEECVVLHNENDDA